MKMKKHRTVNQILKGLQRIVIRDIRMARALELMKDPTARISDIGYRLGFSSSSYFTKIFRETFGMSPKDYRNLRR